MKLLRLNQLPDNREGHFLRGLIPGKYINKGTMGYKGPGLVTHAAEPVHVHDDEEVFIILQGKAKMDMGDRVIPLTVGDVLVVEPGENHHLISDEEDPCINIWCHAGPDRSPLQDPA